MAPTISDTSLNGSNKDSDDEIEYKPGIQKLQQSMNPHQKLYLETTELMEKALNVLNTKLIAHCHENLKQSKAYVGVAEAEAAVKAIFRGETVDHAVTEARRTMFKYENHFVDCKNLEKRHNRISKTLKEAKRGLELGKSLPETVRYLYPEARIKSVARTIIGIALYKLATRIVDKVKQDRTSEVMNITEVEVQSAVEAILTGSLASYAHSEGRRRIMLYQTNMTGSTAPKRVAGLSGSEFHQNLQDMCKAMKCDIRPDGLQQLGNHLARLAEAIVDRLPEDVAIDLSHMEEAMQQALPEQLANLAVAYVSRSMGNSSSSQP